MSTHDATIGLVLDEKYLVERRLGRGGMGAVYLATHLGTSRPVALKVIAPELMRDEAIVERFKREARAAGQLRHPNVVNVTDFGFAFVGGERVAYLVMEHLQGLTLAELLESQPRQPLARVVDIVQQIAAAVEEAHRHGIVHRDLKPENIWLEPRGRSGYTVKVLDFGVAKLREGSSLDPAPLEPADVEVFLRPVDPDAPTLAAPPSSPVAATLASTTPVDVSCPSAEEGITRLGMMLGTPLYMSPEQWLNRGVDARTDVYSLGVIAYQMLAGEVPFSGRSSSISMQHLRMPPPPLEEKAPTVPRAVVGVVMSALEKAPDARPPSAQSFATALAAGAERTGVIVSRAIVLSATLFPTVLAVNVMVFAPPLAAAALRLTSRILVEAGLLPPGVGKAVGVGCLIVHLLSMVFLQPLAAGLVAPRVREALLVSPEPPPRPSLREIVACLRRSWVPSLCFGGCYLILAVLGREPLFYVAHRGGMFPDDAIDYTPIELLVHFLIEIPPLFTITLVLGRFVVYPAVVTVEQLGGVAALRRAAALTWPFRRAAATILGLHVLAHTVTVWICWLVLAQIARVPFLTVIDNAKDSLANNVGLLLIVSIQLVAWTFTFTAMSVLYLNGRQAEGVALDAVNEPEGGAPPGAPALSVPEPRASVPGLRTTSGSREPPPHSGLVTKPGNDGKGGRRAL